MRKWIILTYIITVLMISGFAKASTDILLNTAEYDESTNSISITGLLNGSCGTSLETSLVETQSTEEGPVLVLEVRNKSQKNCDFNQLSINEFDLTIDIKAILKNKISGEFFVTFNNVFTHTFDPMFIVKLPEEAVVGINYETVAAKGTVEFNNTNRQFVLKQNNGDILVLKSNINLNKYLNKIVLIDALEITPMSGPGFELEEQDPLHAMRVSKSQANNSKVFVLGISSTY